MLKKLLAIAALGLMAAGCTTGYNVDAARGLQTTGTTFADFAAREYRTLALYEAEKEADWTSADRYALKALAASRKELTLPEDPAKYRLSAAHKTELDAARARLMKVLDATARLKNPERAAVTQAKFDCWVEQQEEGHQLDHIAACKNAFLEGVAALEREMAPPPPAPAPAAAPPAPPAPVNFIVFFDFDKALITPEAKSILDRAVAAARTGDKSVTVVGHTDSAGSPRYNQRLSERRAAAVKNTMAAGGVAAGKIITVGRGETDLAVPTPDGIPDARNRRAVITLR